jgi:hypothetical protein
MGDLGCPTITCAVGLHIFTNTFYDLGASINVMSKVIYNKNSRRTPVPHRLSIANGGSIIIEADGNSQGHPGKNLRSIHPHRLRHPRHGPK